MSTWGRERRTVHLWSLEKVVELSSFRMDAVYCGFTSDEEHSICVAVISFFGRSRRGS
jgi:hypothetical protein